MLVGYIAGFADICKNLLHDWLVITMGREVNIVVFTYLEESEMTKHENRFVPQCTFWRACLTVNNILIYLLISWYY